MFACVCVQASTLMCILEGMCKLNCVCLCTHITYVFVCIYECMGVSLCVFLWLCAEVCQHLHLCVSVCVWVHFLRCGFQSLPFAVLN